MNNAVIDAYSATIRQTSSKLLVQKTNGRFGPVCLSDERCQELWRRSDTEALLQVAQRFPSILPKDELAQVTRSQDFLFGGNTAYRDFIAGTDGRNFNDEYLAGEFKGLVGGPRWQYIDGQVLRSAVISGFQVNRALDLGAWTGAVGTALSNRFPCATVFLREGTRACEPAIRRTVALFSRYPTRLVLEMGDHLVPSLPRDLDFIYAGEVLEHVPDVADFVRRLEAACRPGGLIAVTTPISSSEETDARVHCRNWDAEDIQEMFGAKAGFRLWVIEESWYVWCWFVSPIAMGTLNWDRKLKRLGFPI